LNFVRLIARSQFQRFCLLHLGLERSAFANDDALHHIHVNYNYTAWAIFAKVVVKVKVMGRVVFEGGSRGLPRHRLTFPPTGLLGNFPAREAHFPRHC